MKFTQRQIGIILVAAVILGGLVFVVLRGLGGSNRPPEVKLLFWGIEDDIAFRDVIQSYQQANPNAMITYQKIDPARYEERLLDALAASEGPDIVMLRNRSLPRDRAKLVPVDEAAMSLLKLRELFPTVVEEDFTDIDRRIYALPLFVDTLALLYNRDYFDSAAITGPPATWKDFQDFVPFLKVLNTQGQIVRAAAPVGGSERSVKSASDLLSLLMLQNGAKMTDRTFSQATFATEEGGVPALRAFEYYLQFANAGSPYYTWNDNQGYSIDAFAQGKAAMVFGYHADVTDIRRKSPFLNLRIAPAPQGTAGTLSLAYADYWGLAVSKQSDFPEWAWDFILFLTTDPARESVYLNATRRPPALRSMIGDRFQDAEYGIFARQALAARSWYQIDEGKIRTILSSAIQAVLTGQTDPRKGLTQAQDQITQLMKSR